MWIWKPLKNFFGTLKVYFSTISFCFLFLHHFRKTHQSTTQYTGIGGLAGFVVYISHPSLPIIKWFMYTQISWKSKRFMRSRRMRLHSQQSSHQSKSCALTPQHTLRTIHPKNAKPYWQILKENTSNNSQQHSPRPSWQPRPVGVDLYPGSSQWTDPHYLRGRRPFQGPPRTSCRSWSCLCSCRALSHKLQIGEKWQSCWLQLHRKRRTLQSQTPP